MPEERNIYDEFFDDDYTPETEEEKAKRKEKERIRKSSIKALKHYLRSAWYWQKKGDFLSDKILILRSKAEKITTTFSDVPTFGGFEDHRQAVIAEMVDTEKKYESAIKECKKKSAEIEFFINLLEDFQEKLILEYRYIYYENWQDIALSLNYEERQVYRIHGRALLNLLTIHKQMLEIGKGLF